jgi:hypothetical protein
LLKLGKSDAIVIFFLARHILSRARTQLSKIAQNLATNNAKEQRLVHFLKNRFDYGVKEIYVGEKLGRGVPSIQSFEKGDFVLEYAGDYLASSTEYRARLHS